MQTVEGGSPYQNKTTKNKTVKTAAQEAFAACGLTYEQVARRVDVSPMYLRHLLRSGCDCYVTADRIRRVLGCPVEFFLPRPKSNAKSTTERMVGRKAAQNRDGSRKQSNQTPNRQAEGAPTPRDARVGRPDSKRASLTAFENSFNHSSEAPLLGGRRLSPLPSPGEPNSDEYTTNGHGTEN